MGGKQLGFGDYEQSTAKKRTKREKFWAEMEAVVPWKALINLASERIPDETIILAFRHLLEKNNLNEQIFQAVKAHLKERGMAMKDHIGVDKDTGLIHSVETTAANVHDLTPASELLHGEEEVVYADAGYQGIEKRPEMKGNSTTFRVAMRPGKRRAQPKTADGRLDDLIETAKARFRAKGEHPFRVIKQQFSFQKIRLSGMIKNRCKVNVLAALANLFLVRYQLLSKT